MFAKTRQRSWIVPPRSRVIAWIFAIPLGLAAMSVLGCSSLLYHPIREPLSNPAQFKHPPRDVVFDSADGTKLHGWYFRSEKRPARATVVFFHGNGQNLTTHFIALYWLLDEGYDYFIFDYRGYGRSEGEPTPEGTVADGVAALKWASVNKDPASKLVVFAQSLGGAIALRSVCEAKDTVQIARIAVDSTFMSYRAVGRKVLSKTWLTWPVQWLAYVALSDRFAPESCLAELAPRPLLVIHGTADPVVDFSLGESLFAAAPEPKEFWRIEGGQHTDFLFREHERYRPKFLEWLSKTSAM